MSVIWPVCLEYLRKLIHTDKLTGSLVLDGSEGYITGINIHVCLIHFQNLVCQPYMLGTDVYDMAGIS